jgi:hypothetical protein
VLQCVTLYSREIRVDRVGAHPSGVLRYTLNDSSYFCYFYPSCPSILSPLTIILTSLDFDSRLPLLQCVTLYSREIRVDRVGAHPSGVLRYTLISVEYSTRRRDELRLYPLESPENIELRTGAQRIILAPVNIIRCAPVRNSIFSGDSSG